MMDVTPRDLTAESPQPITMSGVKETSPPQAIDARAWLIWLAAMLFVALSTRNPFYQALLVMWVVTTWQSPKNSATLFGLKNIAQLGAFAIFFGTVFNALTVHVGQTALWTIPGDVPILSGSVTLEAAAFGASSGFTIILLILIFTRFSLAIDYASILRLMPSALFEMGLMISISFTLIPNMRRAWRDIRHSQALRGHRIQGIRDLAPLVVPLVVNGLERALNLAEAMEARGYAHRRTSLDRQAKFLFSISLVGLLLLVVANTFLNIERLIVVGALIGFAMSMWLGLRRLSASVHRTRFRQNHWTWRETLVTMSALSIAIAFLMATPQMLNFSTYPRLAMPPFNPWLGIATIAAVIPALLSSHHD
jgi:energy-coupling factor transport system permease protein